MRPAYLQGYMRNFRVLSKENQFAAAGIEKRRGERILGMLVEVPEDELTKFDERESLYDRKELEIELLELSEQTGLPEGRFYLYIPKNPECPTHEFPISQSYLDVIVQAFLPYGEEMANEVVSSLQDLDKPWINDRSMPRYSRYLEIADHKIIDELLARYAPKLFEVRKEIADDIRIKPELVNSIMRAIRFYDIFDFPLMAEEVMEYLYKYSNPLHIKELIATLDHLVEHDELTKLKDYYVLPGRESIIETRKTHKFISEKFWNRTKLYGQYMRSVPFVKMIAVCNNLAYDNPRVESDIDLFIVIKSGRMWLARFIITLILQFYGVRRHGNKISGRFCLSFFVTENKLDMSAFAIEPEDPYLAYWVKNLAPIYGEPTFAVFKEQNSKWLSSYGLRFSPNLTRHMYVHEERRVKKFFEWLFKGRFGNLCEGLLKKTLKKKTLRNMETLGPESDVIVSDDILKFHNHDKRKEYYDRWQQSY